jgi:hypothetical protein
MFRLGKIFFIVPFTTELPTLKKKKLTLELIYTYSQSYEVIDCQKVEKNLLHQFLRA